MTVRLSPAMGGNNSIGRMIVCGTIGSLFESELSPTKIELG